MIDRHQKLIYKVCGLYVSGGDMLPDCYQDAVCALWDAYDSFRNQCAESTWIYTVTRNTMIDHLRRNSKMQTSPLDDAVLLPDEGTNAAREELREVLAQLSREERDLIVMQLEGFSIGEIAKAAGRTLGATNLKLQRIKKKIKKLYTQ